MKRKTNKSRAKKAKDIRFYEEYLESLEWKQLTALGVLTLIQYVKHETKSSLVDSSGNKQEKPLLDRLERVATGISQRVGEDFLRSAAKLRELYGVKLEDIVEDAPGETEETEEPEETTDGESVPPRE